MLSRRGCSIYARDVRVVRFCGVWDGLLEGFRGFWSRLSPMDIEGIPMKQFVALLLLGVVFSVRAGTARSFAADPPVCDQGWVDSVVTAPASESASEVLVACNLTLGSGDVVTKRLILEGAAASGVKINCGGATLNGGRGTVNFGEDMLEIRSRSYVSAESGRPRWERPENISITNCNIIGSVRIQSSKSINVLKSRSRTAEYVQWAEMPPENWSRDHESSPGQGAPRRTPCARAGSVRSRSSAS